MSLKNSSIVRGFCFLFLNIKSFFYIKKKKTNIIIGLPIFVINNNRFKIGDGSSIGMYAYISNLNADFVVKDHCAIAERLTVHCGNHARIHGMFITDINERNKPKGYDKDVVVESDVWIGCNVTLLSGVTIGRGTTVAAGAVVARSIPPYCICGGVPAKPIKFYWTIDQILKHEAKLYPENERYTRRQLDELFTRYPNK